MAGVVWGKILPMTTSRRPLTLAAVVAIAGLMGSAASVPATALAILVSRSRRNEGRSVDRPRSFCTLTLLWPCCDCWEEES